MPVTSTTNAPGLLTPSFSRARKMPIQGARYRTVRTPKGPVRLAFKGKKKVVEAKNLRTGATRTPSEFRQDRARQGGSYRRHWSQGRTEKGKDRNRQAKHRGQIRATQRLAGANG